MSIQEPTTGAVTTLTTDESGKHTVTQDDLDQEPLPRLMITGISVGNMALYLLKGMLTFPHSTLGSKLQLWEFHSGTVKGRINDGIVVNVNLVACKGHITFFFKEGHEVWIQEDLNITFNGSYKGDYKILTI